MFFARLVLGATAGAAATWAMSRVTTYLYENEPQEIRQREEELRGHKTATGIAAERAAAAIGQPELTPEARENLGTAIHWGTGIGMGALYGALHTLAPRHSLSKGLLFGLGFFVLVDEYLNTRLGLTPSPESFPWQAHARGLAGHLAWGAAADVSLRALELPVKAAWFIRHPIAAVA